MMISNGIPGSLSTFESHQALAEDFNLGLGCNHIARCPDMDDDFDADNPAYSTLNPWDCQSDDELEFDRENLSDEPTPTEINN